MSNDRRSLDWTRDVPDRETRFDALESDGAYGFLLDGEPFSGILVDYYESGAPERRRPYLNGVAHGIGHAWHENGRLKDEYTSWRGMAHGWQSSWYPDGQVARRLYCEFGCPLEWLKFSSKGRVTDQGSNREDPEVVDEVRSYRERMPDAPDPSQTKPTP